MKITNNILKTYLMQIMNSEDRKGFLDQDIINLLSYIDHVVKNKGYHSRFCISSTEVEILSHLHRENKIEINGRKMCIKCEDFYMIMSKILYITKVLKEI